LVEAGAAALVDVVAALVDVAAAGAVTEVSREDRRCSWAVLGCASVAERGVVEKVQGSVGCFL
jgi:hypothetical protein